MIEASPRRAVAKLCRWLVLSFVMLVMVPAIGSAHGEESGGIGGTGVSGEGGGIGGTGIGRRGVPVIGYGPIQRFGSVFVNNREYAINGRTLVSIDGTPATVAALRVGDIVEVRGTAIGRHHGVARSIAVSDAIIGPVDRVTDGGRSFTVLGQHVVSVSGVRFAGLRPGVTVAVSAQRLADGTWAAQRVTMLPTSRIVRLEASVTAVNGDQVVVAGTGFRVSKPGRIGLRRGQFVTVTGRMIAGVAHATRITPHPALRGALRTRIEVMAYFRSLGAGRVAADGLIATGTAAPPDLDGMRPVEIEGRLTAEDAITIGHVDVDPPAIPEPRVMLHRSASVASPAATLEPDTGEATELPDTPDPDITSPDIERPDIDLAPDHDLDPPDVDIDPDK
ncbi:MAG: DUF5666 domain-containing protein [Acidiphilium sp.]|nr:DUF5666 domain-containing protein [Acidiphilium sp.]MDD4935640.1 DUF5666 domain-containing protein [Acidiphilium sp.]